MTEHVKIIGRSLIMGLLLLAGTMAAVFVQQSHRAFDIGDYSHVSIQAAEEAFQSDGSNQALTLLLKALCFRREVLKEYIWEDKLLAYGQELYARARNETVDLQMVDDEQVMQSVLSVLREVGAHR